MAGTPGPGPISPGLQRIAEQARAMPQGALTTLAHHLDHDLLLEAYRRTRKDGAVGIDGQTAECTRRTWRRTSGGPVVLCYAPDRLARRYSGSPAVLCEAPYGYRYVRKSEQADARYESVQPEAAVVQKLFRRYVEEQESIAGLVRWLPLPVVGYLQRPPSSEGGTWVAEYACRTLGDRSVVTSSSRVPRRRRG